MFLLFGEIAVNGNAMLFLQIQTEAVEKKERKKSLNNPQYLLM